MSFGISSFIGAGSFGGTRFCSAAGRAVVVLDFAFGVAVDAFGGAEVGFGVVVVVVVVVALGLAVVVFGGGAVVVVDGFLVVVVGGLVVVVVVGLGVVVVGRGVVVVVVVVERVVVVGGTVVVSGLVAAGFGLLVVVVDAVDGLTDASKLAPSYLTFRTFTSGWRPALGDFTRAKNRLYGEPKYK